MPCRTPLASRLRCTLAGLLVVAAPLVVADAARAATPPKGSASGRSGKATSPSTSTAPAPAAAPAPVPTSTTSTSTSTTSPPAASPASPRAATRRIAVYRLDTNGLDPRVGTVVTDAVVAELRKYERTTVVGMDEIRAMLDLEAQKQLTGCSDVSCVAEIAEALGVDGLVIGSIAVVGDTISFGLKHIDQHTATTMGQASRRIDGTDPADTLAAVGPVVQELFPDGALKPGTTRGVPAEVALRIHPPPLPPIAFWSVAAASGLALTTGAACTAWNVLSYQAASERLKSSVDGEPVRGIDVVDDAGNVQGSFIALAASYAAAGVLGLGAGITWIFVDWQGYGASDDAR